MGSHIREQSEQENCTNCTEICPQGHSSTLCVYMASAVYVHTYTYIYIYIYICISTHRYIYLLKNRCLLKQYKLLKILVSTVHIEETKDRTLSKDHCDKILGPRIRAKSTGLC